MSKIETGGHGDSREVSMRMLQSAMRAAEDIPGHLRQTFLLILAHRHREAADMIEARAYAEKNGGDA